MKLLHFISILLPYLVQETNEFEVNLTSFFFCFVGDVKTRNINQTLIKNG